MNSANPYAPPRAAVTDVAQQDEELELASRGLRLGAVILDGIISNIFIYVPMFIGTLLVGLSSSRSDGLSPVIVILMLAGLAAWIAITCVFVARNGQTIAKKLLNIKVVRTDGSKASLGRIFWLRNFVPGLLTFTFIFPLLDPLFIFGDTKQCLHDRIADTLVVTA